MNERGRRKTAIGVVTSDKMQKTIVVQRTTLRRHRRYGKYVKQRTTYVAHDENGSAKIGDTVELMQTRPLSKMKRWRLVRVIAHAGAGMEPPGEQPGSEEAELAQAE